MMVLGPEGSGGLPMALAIAQNLVCERRSGKKEETDLFAAPSMFGDPAPVAQDTAPLSDACGECPACQKAAKFIHPDIHYTFPVVSGKKTGPPVSADYIVEWRKALTENPYMNVNDWLGQITTENKQGNITVNECHEIIKGMSLKTFESKYKIQIIWMAEYLREAGNTLLKIIEEPPADTIFILVVENIELILTTVISRTQLIKLPAIEDADLAAHLRTQFEIDEKTALRIARISDGNLNAALEYANGAEHQNDAQLREWLSICLRIKGSQASEPSLKLMAFVDEISKIGRENQKIFLKYFLWFLRESNLLALGLPSEKLEDSELDFARKLATILDPEVTGQLNELVNKVHYYVERNANPKILFLSTSFKIASILKKEEVAYNKYD
ncbi:MAG: polymerase subunit gamma/tau [Bacteroidetes bacterium]|nr:polymerase subunit gamma/tau [Bacteroidota bacterium]